MSSSNVWTRSKARMKLFPELLAQCSGEVHIHPVFLHQYCFVCVCCVVLCVCVCCVWVVLCVCVCMWVVLWCVCMWVVCVVCVCVCERERDVLYYEFILLLLFVHRSVFLWLYYQAAAYGTCVASTTTGKQELAKNMCVKEFEALKSCFQSAVSVFCDYAVHRWVFPNKDPIYTNLH